MYGWVLEIIKRTDKVKGFKLLPRRWVIERFFGWLNWSRPRRLSKHYERRSDSGEALVYLASIQVMTKRLTKQTTTFVGPRKPRRVADTAGVWGSPGASNGPIQAPTPVSAYA